MGQNFCIPAGRKLDASERRIFAHEQIGELAPFTYEILALQFGAEHRREALVAAIEALLTHHPSFTARFEALPGGEVLRHQDSGGILVWHPAEDAAGALDFARELRPRLADRSAFADLWPDSRGGHVLTLVLHPILGDDRVLGEIETMLVSAVTGGAFCDPTSATATGATLTAATLAEARPAALTREERSNRLSWWSAQMESHAIVRVPHRSQPGGQNCRICRHIDLSEADSRDLRAAGGAEALAAVTGLLLARYSGQDRLRLAYGLCGETAARRTATLMPLCLSPDLDAGLAAAIEMTKSAITLLHQHELASERLVQERLSRQNADPHPLGAVALHWQDHRPLPRSICRLYRPQPMAAGELILTAEDRGTHIRISANADGDLLEPGLVERILKHLERLLQQGLAAPMTPASCIPLLSSRELASLSAPYRDDGPIDPRPTHEIIATHAERTPDKIAVICGEDRLTHAQMDGRANTLAHRLIAMGVGREVTVAILIERGADAVVAILASLKAGGAYIPVEPDHPPSRNHHILQDAAVAVVVTRRRYRDRLPDGIAAQILCLEDMADPPRAPLSAHNQATARVYEMSEHSRELPFLPFSSDGGHERWMVPLMMGGSVVIPDGPLWTPEQTLQAMREHGCNNASIPTTYLQQLAEWAEETGSAPAMRLYSFGGEGLAQSTFDLLSRSLNAGLLINGYGPTETIMTPMVWKVAAGTRFDGVYAPLGRAVGDRRAYVLDENMMPCPEGVVGEIYLGGTGVARGYIGKPEVTAERFVPDPFGPVLDGTSGGRLYRTGDLGRWREDGTIEFVGRVDLQIKVNGYRIEPGEIEAALLLEPRVSEALVLLREDRGTKRLIAYVTGPDAGDAAAGDGLLASLQGKLPRHMLPEAVLVLERMPTNPNAKLDRSALPMPEQRGRSGSGEPAKTPTEQKILDIWREIIDAPEMGVGDDFFAMGGQSLTALKALVRMRKLWPECRLTIADLFDASTVRAIAQRIDQGNQTGRSAIALRQAGSKPRLYCFPGLLVSTREYLRLTDYLGPEQPVTGFLCHSLSEDKRQNVSVAEVVADYVAHIRSESTGQACAFLGWSWGGLLAWEAARQLQGEIDLRLISMVDVCDLGRDFTPGSEPEFAPGERQRLETDLQDWLTKTRMRGQWDRLIGAMDAECYGQFLRFIGNESEPLPFDGPEISSREHTFWVLIDNALVFRRHRLQRLDVPIASFSAGDSLSRGLNLLDWRRFSAMAGPAEVVAGTNHLHIIGERSFHQRLKAQLDRAWERSASRGN
jgi:non-ribosomal peptide synthetase component F/thioesterase domain-containing protein